MAERCTATANVRNGETGTAWPGRERPALVSASGHGPAEHGLEHPRVAQQARDGGGVAAQPPGVGVCREHRNRTGRPARGGCTRGWGARRRGQQLQVSVGQMFGVLTANQSTIHDITLLRARRDTSTRLSPAPVTAVPPLSTCSSTICRKPAAVPGAALVMSSLTWLLRTGAKVSVVGWLDAVARLIVRFRTGTYFDPSQYDTASASGCASAVLIVNEACTESKDCGDGQDTDTQSLALETLTAGRLAVWALL